MRYFTQNLHGINIRISMIYLDLLYVYLLLRKQHVKSAVLQRTALIDCMISIKMDSQPCGCTIANTVRVFTAIFNLAHTTLFLSDTGPEKHWSEHLIFLLSNCFSRQNIGPTLRLFIAESLCAHVTQINSIVYCFL